MNSPLQNHDTDTQHSMLRIPEFCSQARISVSFYYKLRKLGRSPAETRIGRRRLITQTTATEWIKSLEHSSGSSASPTTAV